ncbi:amino acid adenylation domain-containing protein [Peterkaempfera bronchialis]|uniref:non-ribosomal peptide synthetase n=1 Tax=Peterkaempfera bronchialis TaxID=2126346 RepID=UPI003C2D6E2D
MTQDLLVELHQRGIKLRLVEGRLDVLAPAGTLTPTLRDELRARRDDLIAVLSGVGSEGRPAPVPRPELRHEPFPLTDIQHAYWVGRRSAMELGGVSTHVYFERERGGLDPERLQQSLRKVVERHDMLRAIVLPDGRQRVLAEVAPYVIPVDDLRGLAPEALRERLLRTRREMDHQVMPADRWPLFDVRVSLLDGGLVRLHVGLDILIMDGFSMYVLFEDWRRFYEDPEWAPEPLELSFRDHVATEEAARDSARYRKAEEYWLTRLAELPPAPALPLAVQPSRLDGRPEFTHRSGRLARERWQAVKSEARRRGLTPSVVLMTAYVEVLRRWSQQRGLTVNLTLLNRPRTHPQMDRLIGDFTSVTLLAAQEDPDAAFAVRAETLQRQLLRDLEHAEFNGVRVMRERSRREGGGPGASMPVVFTSMIPASEDEDRSDGPGFFGDLVHQVSQTPQVWLDHQVTEERGELVFNWDAVEKLFPERLLDDMFASFGEALERLARDPGAWDDTGPRRLPQWQAEERDRANDTAADLPARTLWELVESRALSCPDAVAVITDAGEFGYRQVVDDARRLARRLGALGAEPGALVGVVLDKGYEQVVAVLGVAGSGAAYLPIDPSWPEARRTLLLAEGRVRTVVTSPRLADELAWPDGIHLATLADPEVREADSGPLETAPSPDDLAYVIFTSGSTGRPKGVMIDHRGAANTIQDVNRRFGVGPADRVLALSALSFDLSVYDIFGVLAAGGSVVLPSPSGVHDPSHWTDLVERHGVTVWNSVPALMQAWTDAHTPSADVPSTLRLALLSGDWIPVPLPDAVRARHPRAQVVSLGGATEASIWSVCFPIGEVPSEWARIPYGKPLANQTLQVYDERLRPCPVWATGEILIGGAGVARGYWADPVRTAERFVVHPETRERLYRTGDLGRYLPGGDIEFLGRQDFQVKLNGYRIELGEIEAALRGRPGIAEALASVVANPRTGRRQLVAHVLPDDPAAVPARGAEDAAGLRKALEEVLPGYLVPHQILFIDRVPLTANGKVDRSALPEPWADAAPEQQTAPRDEMEHRLLEMWADALGHADFGVHDNFFELGGDSLHAVRILTRVRQELGIEQEAEEDLEMLFDHPTIAELAEALSSRTGH